MPTEKQRREAERRRLRRQMQRRAQREARRRRFAFIASVVGVFVVAAVVITVVVASSGDKASNPSAGQPSHATCTWTPTQNAAKNGIAKPSTKQPKTGTVNMLVRTTQGSMTFRLDRREAPCAVASFVSLAGQQYFNDTPCHRLTTSSLSVLQCGDPTGTGHGGPGYSFADEIHGQERYTRGVLAMANSGANTNGSQFFIVYKNSPLPPNYTIFGKVTSGMNVVDKVAAKGAKPPGDGKPKLPISLTTVTVVK